MSGKRNAWGAVLALALATAALSCGASNAAPDEDLVKQVQALTQRLEALEREVAALKSRPAAPPVNAQLEEEATGALAEINRLVESGNLTEAKAKLGPFQTKYASTRAGQSAGRLVQELSVVGKESPKDWGIEKWFQGESAVNFNASKGATLVVFWETWCPHCRREVPKLQQVYDTYKPQGLQLIGLTKITKSSTEQEVTSFIAENKVSYPIAKENGATSTYFAVSGIPAAAVVKGGQIVWRGHPGRITDEMIKGWL